MLKEKFKNYLIDYSGRNNSEELEQILQIFKEKEYSKGALFKEIYTEGKHVGFSLKGGIRTFIHSENGEEITARINRDNCFIGDPYKLSDTSGVPFGVQCMDAATLLIAKTEEFEKLLETNLTLNIVIRKYFTYLMLDIGRQYSLFLSGSAKDRYTSIIKEHPELLNNYPLHFIASIIGVTPTQLSRIRKSV